MKPRATLGIMVSGLLVVLLAAGCDGETETDAGADSGRRDSGGADTGTTDTGPVTDTGPTSDSGPAMDSGADGGPGDSGPGDAGDGGGTVMQSRATIVLASPVTLPIVDEAGAPMVLTASAAYDHDTTPGESIFGSDGPNRREMTSVTPPTVTFGAATPWEDGAAAPLDPDFLFAGAIVGSGQALIGVFGTDARIYDFASDAFSMPVALVTTGGTAFSPISATTVNVAPGAPVVAAIHASSPDVWVFNTGSGEFDSIIASPVTCSDGTAIMADHIVAARFAAITPPIGEDSLILISGSDAYLLTTISPGYCFSDAFALVDADGAALTPDAAFGWDFNGDGNDDLILVDTVTLP